MISVSTAEFQNIDDAFYWVSERRRLGIKLGLHNIKRVLHLLGHPEKQYPVIHVAGTNGKGSVCATLTEMLVSAGYRTGLYTSPHLVDLRERFCIDGRNVEDEPLRQSLSKVRAICEENHIDATHFEVITAAAADVFASQGVEVGIFETGMGGRLDATRALDNTALTVLTRIGFDHMNFLGDTLEAIAGEKAGIIRPGVPTITSHQEPEALAVIQRAAAMMEAPIIEWDFRREGEGVVLQYGEDDLAIESFGIHGEHQKENAALAAACARYLDAHTELSISGEAIRQGAANVFWPGRLQLLEGAQPMMLLDVAHNVDGMETLVEFMETNESIPPADKRVVLMGLMTDKEIEPIVDILHNHASTFVFTRPHSYRAVDPKRLQVALDGRKESLVVPMPVDALQEARKQVPEGGILIICGSFYILGGIIEWLRAEGTDVLSCGRSRVSAPAEL